MYTQIGHVAKAHGINGELKLRVEPKYEEDIERNNRIFIDVKGTKIPYFIESLRGTNDIIVKLEDVADRNAAIALQHRELYLRDKDIIPDHLRTYEQEDEDALQYGNLVGFTIVDKVIGTIGTIDEVLDMPQQEMAFLQYQGREVLIPLNDAFIVSVESDQKVVYMDLPEGLLD